MNVQEGSKIRLLEDVKGISVQDKKHKEIIPKYEVVTIVKQYDDHMIIRNILDEDYKIPNILFKIIKKPSKNALKAETSVSNYKVPDGNKIRAIQKMQTIASNIIDCTDINSSYLYTVAAICASMSVMNGIDFMQSNRLIGLTTKLISKANSQGS